MKNVIETDYTPMGALIDFALAGFSRDRMAKNMALSGKRFSKAYRHGETRMHRFVYRVVGSTVLMNVRANDLIDLMSHLFARKVA